MRNAIDGDPFKIGGHEDWLGELLLDQGGELLHLGPIAMDQHDVLRVNVAQEVYDPLGIRVGREGDIDHLHLYLIGLIIQLYLLYSSEQLVSQSALNAIAGNDESIPLIGTPFLEDLHAGPSVQHAWSGEKHVGHISLQQ